MRTRGVMSHRESLVARFGTWMRGGQAWWVAGWALGAAVEARGLEVAITPLPDATARVTVSGTGGATYGIATTEDFLTWTNWAVQPPDSQGQAQFSIPLSSRRLFVRAFANPATPRVDAPEVTFGKRLFFETRFAQFFYAHSNGDVNVPLTKGDPVLDETVTLNFPVPGAFAGQSMNCRACHLVDEQVPRGLSQRAYADFAIRSPIPDRGDGRTLTVRNSPPLANASIPRPGGFFLHFDGEFPSGAALAKGTFTGRNFGWLPTEHAEAVRHIARVIREDDGKHFGGAEFGGAYRRVLLGTDPALAAEHRLPEALRLDVATASDEQLLDSIGRLVEAYMESLRFTTDAEGRYEGSPYDLFLKKNALPRQPRAGEEDLAYGRRLRALLEALNAPVFVTAADGSFTSHTQPFVFGERELEGLKVFLAEPKPGGATVAARVGNCIACHAPPHFTDFDFHNTGATQWEYDAVHGEGEFVKIAIPGLAERERAPNDFLPPTTAHPTAKGRFLAAPASEAPGAIDLGLWNIYANPDFPAVQPGLQRLLTARFETEAMEVLLPKTIALFKTPGLRDLGHSAPYFHTGQSSTIEAVIFFYRFTAELTREGSIRNPDRAMGEIRLSNADASALAAFLKSLNEDFE